MIHLPYAKCEMRVFARARHFWMPRRVARDAVRLGSDGPSNAQATHAP
jgi:hypothetical protein